MNKSSENCHTCNVRLYGVVKHCPYCGVAMLGSVAKPIDVAAPSDPGPSRVITSPVVSKPIWKAPLIDVDSDDVYVAKPRFRRGVPKTTPSPKPPTASVGVPVGLPKVEKDIDTATVERLTGGEKAILVFLCVLGLLGFSVAWWLGAIFIFWGFVYFGIKTEKHQKQILAERTIKVDRASMETIGDVHSHYGAEPSEKVRLLAADSIEPRPKKPSTMGRTVITVVLAAAAGGIAWSLLTGKKAVAPPINPPTTESPAKPANGTCSAADERVGLCRVTR